MKFEYWTVSVRVTVERVVVNIVGSTGGGEDNTVLKLPGGPAGISAHDSAVERVVAATESAVDVEAAGEEEAAAEEELGIEPNKAVRSSERDCMKASSLCCNCSTVNGNSTVYVLELFDSCRVSIDNSVSERSCSSVAIGRAKADAYLPRRCSLTCGTFMVISERLCSPWFPCLCSNLRSSRGCLNGCADVRAVTARSAKHSERRAFARAIVVGERDSDTEGTQATPALIDTREASHHSSCWNRGAECLGMEFCRMWVLKS
jgi:hypothetical protein